MLKINQELEYASIPVMLILQDMMLRAPKDSERHLKNLTEVIGFKYLKGMHLNDSKKEFGTRVDRHDNIGIGFIGEGTFQI